MTSSFKGNSYGRTTYPPDFSVVALRFLELGSEMGGGGVGRYRKKKGNQCDALKYHKESHLTCELKT